MNDTDQTVSDTPGRIPQGLKDRHRTACIGVLNALETALLEWADRYGGTIAGTDICKLTDILRKQPDLFATAFDSVADEFLALGHRREFATMREDSLGRLLVSRFAHLLEGREFGSLEDGALSRSVIVPFFLALRMMVGSETLEDMRHKIDRIIAGKAADPGHRPGYTDDPAFWLGLSQDPKTSGEVTGLLAHMLRRFRDYDKRKQWFIGLINDNMPFPLPLCAGTPWCFTERHFVYIMAALFQDIRPLLLDDAAQTGLQERIGTDTVNDLEAIFARLDADIAALHITITPPPAG